METKEQVVPGKDPETEDVLQLAYGGFYTVKVDERRVNKLQGQKTDTS